MTRLTQELLIILSGTAVLFGAWWLGIVAIHAWHRFQVRRELRKEYIPMTRERHRYLHEEAHRQRRDIDEVV